MSIELRTVPRRQSSEPAMAAFSKYVSVSCVVTDLRPKGARLSFGIPVSLPPRFTVAFVRTGEILDGHLVWQADRVAGVQFGSTISEQLGEFISHLPFTKALLPSPDSTLMRKEDFRAWLFGPRLGSQLPPPRASKKAHGGRTGGG